LTSELSALQKRLGHEFASPRLLERALTHRSFSADHNERLEFLGDSVLSLAISGLLFEKLNQLPEGDLSRVRANLVKQDTLHQMAIGLGLSNGLRLRWRRSSVRCIWMRDLTSRQRWCVTCTAVSS
jgi:ribonuclease III